MKDKQICFFGVYDGHNGVGKAEFYRDNFHAVLSRDEYFLKDMERAVKRSIISLDKSFIDYKKDDLSSVCFVVCVVVEGMVYLMQLGQSKAFLSRDLGEQIDGPFHQPKPKPKHRSINSSLMYRGKGISLKMCTKL